MIMGRRLSYHDQLMAGYYAIREAEEQAAEDATCGYATELAEWWAEHPRTTFKIYLTHQSDYA